MSREPIPSYGHLHIGKESGIELGTKTIGMQNQRSTTKKGTATLAL